MQIYIDNSTLKAVARCSTEAVMRYVWHLTTPDEAAVLKSGTDGHEALAEYFKTGDAAKSLAIFDDRYKVWAADNVPEGDRLSHENVRKIIELYFEDHPLDSFPFTFPSPQFIEVGFQYPLDEHGDVVLTGRMDAVVQDADGDLAPMDNKFTGSINSRWLRKFRNDSQMSGYLWAASQHTGKPLLKSFVNAIELGKLPTSNRKCPTHGTPYAECGPEHRKSQIVMLTRSPKQIEQWKKTAMVLAKRFQHLIEAAGDGDVKSLARIRMEGTFHDACTWCQYFDFCAAGRPAKVMKQMFVIQKWDPLEYSLTGVAPKKEESNAKVHSDRNSKQPGVSGAVRPRRGGDGVGVRSDERDPADTWVAPLAHGESGRAGTRARRG